MEANITRRGMIKAGLAAAAAGATLGVPEVGKAGKTVKLRMQTHWSTGVPWYKLIYEGFANQVNAMTDGEWKITPFPNKTVVPGSEIFEAVGRGVLDMSMSWPSYWVGKIPVATFFSGAPFTWMGFSEMRAFLYEMGAIEIVREAYAEHGIHLVGPVACGPTGFYSTKPLRTPADFKGFKPRCTGLISDVMKGMGASPVFFPISEIYQALQTGVIDGAAFGALFGGAMIKLPEVTKYFNMPYMGEPINADVLVNKKKWDSLPSQLKVAIETATEFTSARQHSWIINNEVKYKGLFKEGGGKIVTANEEAVAMMQKISLDVMDEYAKKDPKYTGRFAAMMKEFMKNKA